ncbi:MAG: DUF1801 domain-containing protein [Candidatus Limnocylindrales bacterium]
MNDAARSTYLAGLDPSRVAVVEALDQAVMAAADFEVAIKYRMLMYSLGGDYHRWVCAIGETTKIICLRFLYGTWLEDPRGLLRAGSSTLMTLDYAALEDVDAALVTDYVREAVSKYPAFVAANSGR